MSCCGRGAAAVGVAVGVAVNGQREEARHLPIPEYWSLERGSQDGPQRPSVPLETQVGPRAQSGRGRGHVVVDPTGVGVRAAVAEAGGPGAGISVKSDEEVLRAAAGWTL